MASKILWVDDEIDLLKPLCIILQNDGYEVSTASSAYDALEMLKDERFDVILLDENMPGMSGLEAISKIKALSPDVNIIMITKSEEENIMEQAIGSNIADYLVKPVRKIDLISSLKKLNRNKLVKEATQRNYQREFTSLSMQMSDCLTFNDWAQLYQSLVRWEIELEDNGEMNDILLSQKRDANEGFCKFIRNNYVSWLAQQKGADVPLMSNRLMCDRVLPIIEGGQKVVLIVIDNFRLDLWETIRSLLAPDFNISTELYCGILPTSTQFARNAIFSGLLPSDIIKYYPQYWSDSDDEGSQNQYERELLDTFFDRYKKNGIKHAYYKVNHAESGDNFIKKFPNYRQNDLNAVVFNFVDMLSHARTDVKVVGELTQTDAAYRSITKSWFVHSALYSLLKILKNENVTVVITTDHGTIKVDKPLAVVGDREVNTNLRFKLGKSLTYDPKKLFEVKNPDDIFLPRRNVSSSYIFAMNSDFFVYKNRFNEYAEKYADTFQHGGVSMEEMIIPFATLTAK